MTNREVYGDEVLDILLSGDTVAVDVKTGKPLHCEGFLCDNCIFHECITTEDNLEKLSEWLKSDCSTKSSDSTKEIINYLNQKTGSRYRTNNKATQRYINARLKEGYTVDDFKRVIDTKCAEWSGTDMDKYLRPETLFGSKFESYLNQQPKTHESNKERSRNWDYRKD